VDRARGPFDLLGLSFWTLGPTTGPFGTVLEGLWGPGNKGGPKPLSLKSRLRALLLRGGEEARDRAGGKRRGLWGLVAGLETVEDGLFVVGVDEGLVAEERGVVDGRFGTDAIAGGRGDLVDQVSDTLLGDLRGCVDKGFDAGAFGGGGRFVLHFGGFLCFGAVGTLLLGFVCG